MTQLRSSHIYTGPDDEVNVDEQLMDPEDEEDVEEIKIGRMRKEMKDRALDQYDPAQYDMPESQALNFWLGRH